MTKKLAEKIKRLHSRIPGNRGGFPKWKSIRKRLREGKAVSEGEIAWVINFEKGSRP